MPSHTLITGVNLRELVGSRYVDAQVGQHRLGGFGNHYVITFEPERQLELQLAVLQDVKRAQQLYERQREKVTIGPSFEDRKIGDELTVWRVDPPTEGDLLFRRDNAVVGLGGGLVVDEMLDLAGWLDGALQGGRDGVQRGPAVHPPQITDVGLPSSVTRGEHVEGKITVAGAPPDQVLIAALVTHVLVGRQPNLHLAYYAPKDKPEDRFQLIISNLENVVSIKEFTVKLK